ncbi:hypothetical protein FDI64_gp43 [Mycobacterium phage Zemanar]|uniref:Uncharacterized protein n=2 Tax=Coopervirus TaxID=1982898 RepID=G1BPF3_9CAUD|nr:hypothetical protein FDI64_gp43 [Mycobacterium phage Zemanar]AEJ95717.1 hypothetical protein ZEMANAR_43 [Mycobacterium phage Zemanar]QOC58602.1 hypothetical protein SEALOLALOVE_43 [Mycobacterium phage Lolalove]
MGSPFATSTAPAIVAASDGQLNFIRDLLNTRQWQQAQGVDKHVSRAAALNIVLSWAMNLDTAPGEVVVTVEYARSLGDGVNAVLATMRENAATDSAYLWAPLTRQGASALIDWLKSLPTQANVRVDDRRYEDATVEVPAGRYAIDTQVHAVNGTAFYKVDRPETGRWAGYVFVKQIIGSDEQKLSMKQGRAILARIAAVGAEAASARYGHEIGECGICGRQLTNDESRARGIGPVCAAKAGW